MSAAHGEALLPMNSECSTLVMSVRPDLRVIGSVKVFDTEVTARSNRTVSCCSSFLDKMKRLKWGATAYRDLQQRWPWSRVEVVFIVC